MAYATEAQLDVKWGSENVTLVSIDVATGERSSDKIAAALDSASARMDAVFLKRNLLPLDPTAGGAILLRNLACDLAMGELANTPGARNDIIKDAEKRALDFLSQIAAGKADIPVNAVPGAGGAGDLGVGAISPNEALVISNERLFTRNRMRDM